MFLVDYEGEPDSAYVCVCGFEAQRVGLSWTSTSNGAYYGVGCEGCCFRYRGRLFFQPSTFADVYDVTCNRADVQGLDYPFAVAYVHRELGVGVQSAVIDVSAYDT